MQATAITVHETHPAHQASTYVNVEKVQGMPSNYNLSKNIELRYRSNASLQSSASTRASDTREITRTLLESSSAH